MTRQSAPSSGLHSHGVRGGWDGSRAVVLADSPGPHLPYLGTSPYPGVCATEKWLPWKRRPQGAQDSRLTRAAPGLERGAWGPHLPPSLRSHQGQPTASFKSCFQAPLLLRGRNSRLSLLFVGSINSQSFRSLARTQAPWRGRE